MLAKVPRIITSWLPRRVPYWLKSATPTPWSVRYLPAGEAALIEPAGEMWSVVILSPNRPSTRAPLISPMPRRLAAHADEIGRVLHIGRIVVPGVGLAFRRLHRLPVVVAVEDVGIFAGEELARDVLGDELVDLLRRRPDVLEEHRIAVAVLAERLGGQVHGAPCRPAHRRRPAAARRDSSPARRATRGPRSCGCRRARRRRSGPCR